MKHLKPLNQYNLWLSVQSASSAFYKKKLSSCKSNNRKLNFKYCGQKNTNIKNKALMNNHFYWNAHALANKLIKWRAKDKGRKSFVLCLLSFVLCLLSKNKNFWVHFPYYSKNPHFLPFFSNFKTTLFAIRSNHL